MKGYWNKPEATAEVLKDGWFHTGDLGLLDELGFLIILDRAKDIVIRGGKTLAAEGGVCDPRAFCGKRGVGVRHSRFSTWRGALRHYHVERRTEPDGR